jgi:hypothetical protein
VTIRGLVRKVDDDTRRYVDPYVLTTLKGCELLAGGE